MAQFNTSSPDQLIYENSILTIEVLGGVRLEGLDRMRVTLKVSLNESGIPPVRHNLDLYNDTQLEKFIRKIAERLEVGTSVTAGTLAELTLGLENYRLEKIKDSQGENQSIIPLTEMERQAAEANLKVPNLLEQTIQDLGASGIQGEAENALILLLAMTSRKTPDPISVICLARSGVGKSYLMERVALCMPDQDKKEHTQFTGNSFYYYKREEIRNKIFLIEDLEGAVAVMFPIRELQSKKRISKTITQKGRDGKLQTITLIVEGPVCVIACTTKESIYEDNANRSILIYLNDSKEQDEKIMSYQKRHRAGMVDRYKEQEIQIKLQQMQKALVPINVINPYAPLIEVPQEVFKKRRTLPMLLNFIEAITFYNQYQRKQTADQSTGEVQIETHPSDIEWGFKLLSDVLFRKSDELSGAVRDFYEWVASRHGQSNEGFLASQIRQENKMHPRTLNRYLQELLEYGYLHITGGKKQRTGYIYTLIPTGERKAVEERINGQIKEVMEKVWKAYQQKNKKKKDTSQSDTIGHDASCLNQTQ